MLQFPETESDQQGSQEDFKIYRPHNRNSVHVECESKSDTGIIWVTETISKTMRQYLSNMPGKHKIKELQKSHIGHCTHTTESANVKVQNILHRQNNITRSTNCKHRTAATLYTLEAYFVSSIQL